MGVGTYRSGRRMSLRPVRVLESLQDLALETRQVRRRHSLQVVEFAAPLPRRSPFRDNASFRRVEEVRTSVGVSCGTSWISRPLAIDDAQFLRRSPTFKVNLQSRTTAEESTITGSSVPLRGVLGSSFIAANVCGFNNKVAAKREKGRQSGDKKTTIHDCTPEIEKLYGLARKHIGQSDIPRPETNIPLSQRLNFERMPVL